MSGGRMSGKELERVDAMEDLDVVAQLVISVRRNGAMSVAGCIHEEAYALAMLESARDVVKSHNARRRINEGGAQALAPESSLVR